MTIQLDHELDRLINSMIAADNESTNCATQYLLLEMALLDMNDKLKAMEQRVTKNEDRISAIDAASFKRSWV